MTYIYFVFDKIIQFSSWLNTEVGLKPWHVQTIAITIIIVLLLVLRHLRKNRIEKIRKGQRKGRSEIIGLKLSDRRTKHRRVSDRKKQDEDLIQEDETQHKAWGQTTKDWRQLREQIRKLQHDIKKKQRTEEQLQKQITELKNINNQLKEEIVVHKQAESDLNHPPPRLASGDAGAGQINELKTVSEKQEKETTTIKQDPNIKQPDEEPVVTEEKKEANPAPTASSPGDTSAGDGKAHLNTESENLGTESEPAEKDTQTMEEKETSEQTKTENNPEKILKNNAEQTEELKENHNVPLDIKELKTIADLAKRLQGGGPQKT